MCVKSLQEQAADGGTKRKEQETVESGIKGRTRFGFMKGAVGG